MLAGGRSRRFGGTPKGLETIGGVRIIDRVVAALDGVTQDLVLVANDPAAGAWMPGARVVADARTDGGGLAGIEAALGFGRDIVVVAWDMPFVGAILLQSIVATARRVNADAVAPRGTSAAGVEPFCAFYASRTRDALGRFLDSGRRAAYEFIASLARVELLDDRVPGMTPHALLSINSRADLARARALAENGE